MLKAIWSLKKPDITKSADYGGTYDALSRSLTASVQHELPAEKITYQWYKDGEELGQAVTASISVKNVNDSGSYYCVVTVTDGGQSSSAQSGDIEVNIVPKSLAVQWGVEEGHQYVYSNQNIAPVANADTGIVDEVLSISVSGAQVNASEAAYTAVASTDNSNYILTNVSCEFYINKADYDIQNISFSDSSYIYDGNEKSLNISGALPIGLDGIPLTVVYSGSAKDVSDGKVKVSAIFATESPNYNIPAIMTADVSILPKAVTVTAKDITVKEGEALVLDYFVSPALVGDDSFTGSLSVDSTEPGLYDIKQGTLMAGGNYTITFVGAICTINAVFLDNEKDAEATLEIPHGINPEAEFELNIIDFEHLDDKLSVPEGRKSVASYNGKLLLNALPLSLNETVTLNIKAPNGLTDGDYCEILYIKNGDVFKVNAIVADGHLTFDIDALGDILIVAKTQVQLAKDNTEAVLKEYITEQGVSNPSEKVIQIIDSALLSIDEAKFENSEQIIENAKKELHLQIEKEKAKDLLDKYLTEIVGSEKIITIIADAKTALDSAESIDDINSIVAEAKESVENELKDKILNLWWIIILLPVVILLEVLAIFYIKHKKNNDKAKHNKKQQKLNSFGGAALLSYIIIPNHAILIIILLSIAVIVLGVYIALLLIRFGRGNKQPPHDGGELILTTETEDKIEKTAALTSAATVNASPAKTYILCKKSFTARLIQSPTECAACRRYTENRYCGRTYRVH